MDFWSVLLENLPLVIIIIIAIIICGAKIIEAFQVWKNAGQNKVAQQVNQQIEEKQKEINLQEELAKIAEALQQITQHLESTDARIAAIEEKLQDLTISDMHDIKSWIVEQYQKFYVHQGWIDAFSAETIDRRYSDYKKEGGNSYIENLIDQLHTLSMDPEHSRFK